MVIAMLIACGGHWVLLQTMAWTKMIADFSQNGDLKSAITKTFDGSHACSLCKCIKAGKEKEKKQDASVEAGKFAFIHQPSKITLWRPGKFRLLGERFSLVIKRANEPPTPPPRGTLV